ncbi:Pro-neuropeptide Y [Anthophora quadrimaculata]
MQSYSCIVYLLLSLVVLGITVAVHGEPEPMARPTRPEVFTSPEELRRYLDHVSDYYSLSGKARYGKRGNTLSSTPDVNHIWDTMKTILENSQRSQQVKLEKRKWDDSRFSGELESTDDRKLASRLDVRPCHVLDIVDKYYDDVQ